MQDTPQASGAAGASFPHTLRTSNLGFASVGAHRELKTAVESYWNQKSSIAELHKTAATLRAAHWRKQAELGIDDIPSNDFSFYDRMLDLTFAFNALPARFEQFSGLDELDQLFAAARGRAGVEAMEMTKWFDTNYHYVVPELHAGQAFTLRRNPLVEALRESQAIGIRTRPVVIGPLTYLLLSRYGGSTPLELLDALLPVYVEMLSQVRDAGATEVQIDEPALVFDLDDAARRAYTRAYASLKEALPGLSLALTTYFGGLGENLKTAAAIAPQVLHVDLTRVPDSVTELLDALAPETTLSCGIVDGRNIWRCDLERAAATLENISRRIGAERMRVAPSCSLLHVPIDLELEPHFDPELRSWLAFGVQKLAEIRALGQPQHAAEALRQSREARQTRAASARVHDAEVGRRIAAIDAAMLARPSNTERAVRQRALGLPLYPTTTIGSLPQTSDVRKNRAELRRGAITPADYDRRIRGWIDDAVRFQREAGIDVLVHGEFERNDMVEFFGENLEGYVTSENGWVVSYGTRCVKPPILFGDVKRAQPMTVELTKYAQSLTDKPMKGMLTGPVTILQWSFVRDDQPRSHSARAVALALRDEVADLCAAGITIVQIDEPALREGLPLRRADRAEYLRWGVDAFRLAAAVAPAHVQIHTHMCYAEFDDIVTAIAELDVDVISLEAARSHGAPLAALLETGAAMQIGAGVYDIHSPNIPAVEDIVARLESATKLIGAERVWVNPDCGLKTRRWEEVRPALEAMVAAARKLRAGARQPAPAA